MVRDEKKAPHDYSKLLKQMHSPREKAVIRSIIKDERKHKRLLMGLK